jgi:outer membrane protein assembly factor BamB
MPSRRTLLATVPATIGCTAGCSYLKDFTDGDPFSGSDRLKWLYPTDGRVRSSPALSNGILYVGSNDGNLRALDPVNGTLEWSFRTDASISSDPAVTDGTI